MTAWRLPLLLVGGVLLLIGLIWLARREESRPPLPAQPPVEVQGDQQAVAREQVEAFLAAAGVAAEAIVREPPDRPQRYQIRARLPDASAVAKLRQRLQQQSPALALTTPEDGVLLVADGRGQPLLSLHFLPPPPTTPPKAVAPMPGKAGRVAIIMDDLGRGTSQARKLLAIRQPVTFAILPGEPHAAEVARMAHAAGREVMLHVPLEPQGFPVVDPGDDALFARQSNEELRHQLTSLLDKVPHAAGVNNHMGSRFTEDERAMGAVMEVLRERRLFFIDSLTTGHSVASVAARRAGVPILRRDVFLDNVADVALISREIHRLAGKARRNGTAVGICHPYPETFEALRRELPALAAQGVEFVSVAELLVDGED